MDIQFLGTSAGTPTRSRNMTALALRSTGTAKGWTLVDCAEGTQYRMQRAGLSPVGLRAVFITHLHGDHCYGLPGLLASAGMLNRSAPLPIVAPAPLRAMIESIMDATRLELPYALDWIAVEDFGGEPVLPDLRVRATPLSHRMPCWAYSFTEAEVEQRLDRDKLRAGGIPSGPAWGAIQQGQNVLLADGSEIVAADFLQPPRKARKIIVGGDNDDPGLLAQEALDADVLVHEATYTEEILRKIGPGPQHSSAAMVARFAQQAGLPNLVLTHFSPRYADRPAAGALSLGDIEQEARAHYNGNLLLARDLDRYELNKDGMLQAVSTSPRPMTVVPAQAGT